MTIVRVGSNEKYASNWDQVFTKKSKKAAEAAKPAKASTKKKAAKKAAAQKAAPKKSGKKKSGKKG